MTFFDGSQTVASVPLTAAGDASRASVTVASLAVGTRTLTASYAGSTMMATSVSEPVVQTISIATTTTVLTSSVNPSKVGAPITLTARVVAAAPGGGVPAGVVNFVRDSTVMASVSLVGGVASLTTTPTKAGKLTFTARYGSGESHAASTSPEVVQTVVKK